MLGISVAIGPECERDHDCAWLAFQDYLLRTTSNALTGSDAPEVGRASSRFRSLGLE